MWETTTCGTAADSGEISEATAFLSYFNDLTDTRQPGKVVYPLDEMLLLSLLAVLAGAETMTYIARFHPRPAAMEQPRGGFGLFGCALLKEGERCGRQGKR